jgi:hypothetical protein
MIVVIKDYGPILIFAGLAGETRILWYLTEGKTVYLQVEIVLFWMAMLNGYPLGN